MCTVTFLPINKDKFILTSNRDESPDRKIALPPQDYLHNNIKIIYPKDGQASGTWIVTSENDFTLCLLNGAFKFHHHKPPYKLSRGLMLLDFFNYNDAQQFSKNYDFSGIEPFTLLVIHHKNDIELTEIRWTEESELFISSKNPEEPHIWSSATLYSIEKIEQRKKWFSEWLDGRVVYEVDDILHFHHFGGTGDHENDILMNRDNVRTISVTSVTNKNDGIEMIYEDLLKNQTTVYHHENDLS